MTFAPGPSWRALLVAVLVASAGPAAASADPDPANPRAWLDRMGEALERQNYQGTLVELDGDGATVMRVVHRYSDGIATERLTALDGIGREIVRRGDEVTVILPDQRTVLVDRRENIQGSTSRLREQFAGPLRFPEAHYRLAGEPGGEVLGRPTQLVTVRSADGFRYGYRLWLDRATAMPLKVQVVDEQGAIVEQVLFADIRLGEAIDDAAVKPSQSTEGFAWRRAAGRPDAASAYPVASPWVARRLPPGFTLRAMLAKPGRGDAGSLTQVVYTDGVATVSVFVEPVGAPRASPAGGAVKSAGQSDGPSGSHVGGANVYTLVTAGHLVTAMGEVPARTTRAIAEAMRPEPAANARSR